LMGTIDYGYPWTPNTWVDPWHKDPYAADPYAGAQPVPNIKPCTVDLEGLDVASKQLLSMVSTTGDRVKVLRACVARLNRVLKTIGPDWKVASFGSAVNGFGTRHSDLDATCYRMNANGDEFDVMQTTEELRYQVLPLLEQQPYFTVVGQIWSARIPILKLQFREESDHVLDVDLSCHNTQPLSNTKLLRAYSQLDPNVRNLGIIMKHWAKAEQVCGAAEKNLSSYSLILMVIYFLQVHPSLHLPCLPTSAFQGMKNSTMPKMTARWHCTQSLPMLIYNFFHFFAHEFDWGAEVVSVRVGKRLSANDATYVELRGRRDANRIHLEDPFLRGRNLNCVLSQEQEQVLRSKIIWSAEVLQKGLIPQSLRLLPKNFPGKDRALQERVVAYPLTPGLITSSVDAGTESKDGLKEKKSAALARAARANSSDHAAIYRDINALRQAGASSSDTAVASKDAAAEAKMASRQKANKPASPAPQEAKKQREVHEDVQAIMREHKSNQTAASRSSAEAGSSSSQGIADAPSANSSFGAEHQNAAERIEAASASIAEESGEEEEENHRLDAVAPAPGELPIPVRLALPTEQVISL